MPGAGIPITPNRVEQNGNYPLRFPSLGDFAAPRTIIEDVPWLDDLSSTPYYPTVIDMSTTHVARSSWLAKYHLWYSSDHGPDEEGTGAAVAYTNNLKGDWTLDDGGESVRFSDPEHGDGYTGAWSPMYDRATQLFYAQWHQKSSPGTATEVYYATSSDGLSWTYQGKWLDAEHPWIGTHRHNSYGRLHPLGDGGAVQIHNIGSGMYTHNTLAWCPSLAAAEWFGNGKVLDVDDKERTETHLHYNVLCPSRMVYVAGQHWLIHSQREVYPVLYNNDAVWATPWKADWSGPAGPSRMLVNHNNDADDQYGAAYPEAIVVDDELHIFYCGKTSSGQTGKNIRHTWASLRAL